MPTSGTSDAQCMQRVWRGRGRAFHKSNTTPGYLEVLCISISSSPRTLLGIQTGRRIWQPSKKGRCLLSPSYSCRASQSCASTCLLAWMRSLHIRKEDSTHAVLAQSEKVLPRAPPRYVRCSRLGGFFESLTLRPQFILAERKSVHRGDVYSPMLLWAMELSAARKGLSWAQRRRLL